MSGIFEFKILKKKNLLSAFSLYCIKCKGQIMLTNGYNEVAITLHFII